MILDNLLIDQYIEMDYSEWFWIAFTLRWTLPGLVYSTAAIVIIGLVIIISSARTFYRKNCKRRSEPVGNISGRHRLRPLPRVSIPPNQQIWIIRLIKSTWTVSPSALRVTMTININTLIRMIRGPKKHYHRIPLRYPFIPLAVIPISTSSVMTRVAVWTIWTGGIISIRISTRKRKRGRRNWDERRACRITTRPARRPRPIASWMALIHRRRPPIRPFGSYPRVRRFPIMTGNYRSINQLHFF